MLSRNAYMSPNLFYRWMAPQLPPRRLCSTPIVYHTCPQTGADAYSVVDDCEDNRNVTLAFRGTKGRKDLLADVDVRAKVLFINESGMPLYVHSGFANQYSSIETSVMATIDREMQRSRDRPLSITCTGHSLTMERL